MLDSILTAIGNFFTWCKNLIRKIVEGILNFVENVVRFFKNLLLDPNKHKPFIANKEAFKEMLKGAPIKNAGIFQAVYNEETDEIEHGQVVEADQLDEKTREVLGNEKLVLLT